MLMKLTNYIIDMGRVIAYYPNLKRVTGSTTATILLCQFLYWSNKTRDNKGWIYKTSEEIEEETGLTRWEQQTAKEKLVELKLLESEFKRLDHTSRYKVNEDELNSQWEEVVYIDKTTKEASKKALEEAEEKEKAASEKISSPEIKKKGDWVDCIVESQKTKGREITKVKESIRRELESSFHINAKGKRWDSFIDFSCDRQITNNEQVSTFIGWALREGFNPVYWTPEKMITLYPQAFTEKSGYIEPPVTKIYKEEDYAPMPESIGRKKD